MQFLWLFSLGVLHLAFARHTSLWDRVKRDEEPDYPVSDYLENCGMTHRIEPGRPFNFGTPYFGSSSYPPSIKCSWTFVGNHNCRVSVSCPVFDLRENPDCEDEFLELTDGNGGLRRLCGNKNVTRLVARNDGTDLFVRMETMAIPQRDREYRGFLCEASCAAEGTTELRRDIWYFKEDPRCVCGIKNFNDRIVGGNDSASNEFPWQAAIVPVGTRKPKCGATAINDRWFLSAAHCFALDHSKPHEYEVLLHAHVLDQMGNTGEMSKPSGAQQRDLADDDEGTKRYAIQEIITHPLFNDKYDYDVALIKTTRKIDFSERTTPVCLPDPGASDSHFTEGHFTVTGWGKAHEDAVVTNKVLQKLEVPILSQEVCEGLLPKRLTRRMFCAGYVEGGKDACQGDSGGPLVGMNTGTGQFTQIGIVSWGEGCAQANKAGVYTRVTAVSQWIKQRASSGVWCGKSSVTF